MSDYNQDAITKDVLAAFANTPDARLRELTTALVKHIHAFAREVDLTPEEWLAGLKFLDATGRICTDKRPEFILLSDTLGLSMMVVALAQARASGAAKGAIAPTEATVEGPFYWAGAPELPLGSDIGEGVPGEPAFYMGRVTDLQGAPLAGALLDVWSGDGDGKYDVQLSSEPTMRHAGAFAPTSRAATGSGRSAPPTTRCPTTARWATCCAPPAAASIARATSTCSSRRLATCR